LLCSGAALAGSTSPVSALQQSSSPIVTVQPKDTAYGIARKYGLSVDALLALNGLTSPDLEIGQVLRVSPATYKVVAGDTAYAIARRNSLSVDALLSFNNLSSASLTVGQELNLGSGRAPNLPTDTVASVNVTANTAAPALTTSLPLPDAPMDAGVSVTPQVITQITTSSTETTPMSGADWLSNAQSLLGVPYVWGGKSRKGTDCSGFVLQVFAPLGLSLPRTSADQAQAGWPVERAQLQSGDLVFFDIEGRGKVTHVGIVVGTSQFINANSYAGRVAIDDLTSRYWASRYLGARRVLGNLAMSGGH